MRRRWSGGGSDPPGPAGPAFRRRARAPVRGTDRPHRVRPRRARRTARFRRILGPHQGFRGHRPRPAGDRDRRPRGADPGRGRDRARRPRGRRPEPVDGGARPGGRPPAAVLALGGGSALDAAKGISLLAGNPDAAAADADRLWDAGDGLPLIAVPTTAGTGAETNGFGVTEDRCARRKVYIGHSSVKPRIAVLDPELTLGLPARVTAATGLDALVHGIESLASRGSTPFSAAYATQAVTLVGRWLPAAYRDGGD